MTRWGLLLLVGYVAIGLSGMEQRKATRAVVWLTVATIGFVGIKVGAL